MKTWLLLFATCLVALFESRAGSALLVTNEFATLSSLYVDSNAVVIVGSDLIMPVPTGYRRNPRQEGFESESTLFGGRVCKTVAWFEGPSDTNAVDVVTIKADRVPSKRYSVELFKSNCKKFANEVKRASAIADQVFGRTESGWNEHFTAESFSMVQLQKIEFGEYAGTDPQLRKLRQVTDLLQQTLGGEATSKPIARYVRKASVLVRGHIIAIEHRQVFREPIDESEVIGSKAALFRDWEQELRRINPELSQMSPEGKSAEDNSTQNLRHEAGSSARTIEQNAAVHKQDRTEEPLKKLNLACVLPVVVVIGLMVAFFVKCAREADACHRQELGAQKEQENRVDIDAQDVNQPEGRSSEGKVSESADSMGETTSAIKDGSVMTAGEPKTEAQQGKTFRRAPSSVQTIAVVLVLEAAVWFITAPSIGGVVSLIVRFLIARAAVRGSAGAKIVLYVLGLLGLLVGILIMALSTSRGDGALAKMFFYGGGFNLLMGVLLNTRSARKWAK